MEQGKRGKKTNHQMKKAYRFTLDKRRYAEIISILDSIPKSFRSEFIAESIKVAREYYVGKKGEKNEPPDFKGTLNI
jgi:hypothetical protein